MTCSKRFFPYKVSLSMAKSINQKTDIYSRFPLDPETVFSYISSRELTIKNDLP
jgi:hypothetical protein